MVMVRYTALQSLPASQSSASSEDDPQKPIIPEYETPPTPPTTPIAEHKTEATTLVAASAELEKHDKADSGQMNKQFEKSLGSPSIAVAQQSSPTVEL